MLASPADLSHLITALGDHAADENIALVCDRLPGQRLLRLTCGPAKVQVLGELPGLPDEPACSTPSESTLIPGSRSRALYVSAARAGGAP